MRLLALSALALALLATPAHASTIVLLDDGHHVTSQGKIRPSDRFRVGSVSKTFVATTVLQLEAEHRLTLDDTADRYVPQAPAIPLREPAQPHERPVQPQRGPARARRLAAEAVAPGGTARRSRSSTR